MGWPIRAGKVRGGALAAIQPSVVKATGRAKRPAPPGLGRGYKGHTPTPWANGHPSLSSLLLTNRQSLSPPTDQSPASLPPTPLTNRQSLSHAPPPLPDQSPARKKGGRASATPRLAALPPLPVSHRPSPWQQAGGARPCAPDKGAAPRARARARGFGGGGARPSGASGAAAGGGGGGAGEKMAAGERSGGGGGGGLGGPAARCHRAGPGPGLGAGAGAGLALQEEEEEEQGEEEEQQQRRPEDGAGGGGQSQAQARGLGLVKREEAEEAELELRRQQEEEEGEEEEEEEEAEAAEVEVELELEGPEEPGVRDRPQFPDKQRILIVDEQGQRVEEAMLCRGVDWEGPGAAPWPRPGSWSPERAGSPRARGDRPPRPPRGASREVGAAAPAQRRRKSEYPRRRSCISFTYGAPEAGGRRPEEGEESTENSDLQRLGTSHREPLPELPVLHTAPVVLMKTRPVRGRWRGKGVHEEPDAGPGAAPESRWEEHYWQKAAPSGYPRPEGEGRGLGAGETDVETETMQLICESVSETSQQESSISLEGLAAAAALPDSIREPDLVHSEGPEDLGESDDDVPFRDDPKDEMYEPSPHRERGKQRRKARKEKLDSVEQMEPPKRRLQRPKEDRGPRPPKKRKKPPIQYVRCEMEGCGTILANPRYLQHHMRYQHMLKKKYVCPHPSCGRLFRLQKQLLRHTKHHSDQRDYICEYCARAFKSSHNLAVHRMIHTGEKPLQCEICGFTCRQKASLNWHMKKHDADANYQFSCTVCGKKFEKKDSVVAHKSKSHPELVIARLLAENT
ncbi:LOW QUALITY PROTEIN: E3 ubiquitin-protein ligase ZFP91-like [Pristis pectinata]|uniref:LOW QUALITY PROTEIN: E3 ubiquitin-protein ligase ZFP91-like n=1 Tax=Pristis pectinata TaxID=685728 RepID=UPI00223E8461|nr:LOW QUALITY PROTEIN: E3 ubiquitin-protein ligase ZFP91-like [Pristis pectinata]